mgnify:CR=1 FL=1
MGLQFNVLIREYSKVYCTNLAVEKDVIFLIQGRGSRQVPYGNSPAEILKNAWLKLQSDVNCLMDSDMDKITPDKFPGIRQVD